MDRRTSRLLIERLNRDGEQIARRFGLRYKAIVAERANVTSRYGACFDDGTIKIRLRHAVTGSPLKYSSLVNTLCHELAHLRHFHHGDTFKDFYQQILRYARAQRLYQPRLPGSRAVSQPMALPEAPKPQLPVQLALF
jgi:predicted metal-dependent hydrolase